MAEGEGQGTTGRRVAMAALLLAASQLLSRLMGFVREAVLAWQVGVGPQADAYQAAFQIPDLLNYFLAGGALGIAFIPLYQRAREREGEEAAERLLATVLGTLGAAVVAATVLLFAFAEELVAFQFRAFSPDELALTTRMTRIVLPAQIAFFAGGVVRAALMARGRFAAQAVAPVVYNGGIILGGVLLAPRIGVEGFAWGALAGAFAGPLGAALLEARGRVRLGLRVAPGSAAFRRYLALAAPLLLGVSLLTVDEWYDRWFGQLVGTGAIGLLFYARRLMQVPVAAVGQTVATAALPALSRLHEQGRAEELGALLQRTLQASLGVALLAAGGLAACATPVVTLVYVRGAFLPADAGPVAAALAVFCAAVPGWVLQQVAVRAFYARGEMWTPMLLGTGVSLAAIPLYLVAAGFGPTGLAAAGALAISVNALATLGLARQRHGAPALGPLLASGARGLGAVAPAAAAAWWVQGARPGALGALLDLALGGAVYLAVAAA
ncbi:MAG: murein biosynthesis integral membrane protein MurJ, partial [Myxococcota bacterium]|nr:murein biosynthesis integral membrane protein MurJ [Myxococcota bacterium]